jgi:hypothetical protein
MIFLPSRYRVNADESQDHRNAYQMSIKESLSHSYYFKSVVRCIHYSNHDRVFKYLMAAAAAAALRGRMMVLKILIL